MGFPYSYTPPAKFAGLSDDELIDEIAQLTQDLINLRSDHAALWASWNSRFFKTFLDCHEESVAARNRLAESDTTQLKNELVQCEANIAATEDLCALVRTILTHRSAYG